MHSSVFAYVSRMLGGGGGGVEGECPARVGENSVRQRLFAKIYLRDGFSPPVQQLVYNKL